MTMSSEDYAALAAAQAMYKALGRVVSTKDPASLRSRMDAELRQLWADRHVFGKVPLVIGGHVVGMLTAKQAKPTTRTEVTVSDVDALVASQADMLEAFARENPREFAWWLVDQGVAPEGVDVVVTEEPGGWGGTMITGCKPDEVIPLLRGELPPAIALAIEGEVE